MTVIRPCPCSDLPGFWRAAGFSQMMFSFLFHLSCALRRQIELDTSDLFGSHVEFTFPLAKDEFILPFVGFSRAMS